MEFPVYFQSKNLKLKLKDGFGFVSLQMDLGFIDSQLY